MAVTVTVAQAMDTTIGTNEITHARDSARSGACAAYCIVTSLLLGAHEKVNVTIQTITPSNKGKAI